MRQPLMIDYHTVSDGHIHGGGLMLCNSGDGLKISVGHIAGTVDVEFIMMDAIMKLDGGRLKGVS